MGSQSSPGLTNGHVRPSNFDLYAFPQTKLKRRLTQPGKTPLVLVACGSFSPATVLHLQMFDLAQRRVAEGTDFEVIGNYLSPCSDAYNKSSLVPAHHRLEMCNLAVAQMGANVEVDDWETLRKDDDGNPLYSRTVDVLRHFDACINDTNGGIHTADGESVRARVMLLIGADLALTMGDPELWAPDDLDVLLGYYGAFIVDRPHQTDIETATEALRKYRENIWVVKSFENDVSSTKVRAQIKKGDGSVDDIPESVFDYVKRNQLYT